MEPEYTPRSLSPRLFLHHFPTRAFLGHKCAVYPTPFAITKEQLSEACWVGYKHRGAKVNTGARAARLAAEEWDNCELPTAPSA